MTDPLVAAAPAPRRNLLPVIALLALNAAAGAAVWHAINMPVDTAPITGPSAAAAVERPSRADPDQLLGRQRTAADLPETAKRPLFSVNRRPWVEKPKAKPPEEAAAKAAPPAPPFPADQLLLVGVQLANRSTAAKALIRVTGEAQGAWVQVGESIRGWKLRNVTADNAIIEARGLQTQLTLEVPPVATAGPVQPKPR
jgi:hypothetical protein